MGRIGCVAVVKNEEAHIAEWLIWQFLVGFDTVFLVDNGSTDRTAAVARSLAPRFDVRVFDYPYNKPDYQVRAYEQTARIAASEYEWLGFFDTDEFLRLDGGVSLKTILPARPEAAVAVPWAMFGSNGHEEKPDGLVIEAFTRRAPASFEPNRHVKSIIRPGLMEAVFSPHAFTMRGDYVDLAGRPVSWGRWPGHLAHDPDYAGGALNHYFTRSAAHWREKLARGYASGRVRTLEEFTAYDRNELLDDKAARRGPEIRAMLTAPISGLKPPEQRGPAARQADAAGTEIPALQSGGTIRAGVPLSKSGRVWIRPLGNLGNRTLQYLAAAGIRRYAPEVSVENLHLPEWGMTTPTPEPQGRRSICTGEFRSWLDVAGLADCLRRGVVESVILDGYAFHLGNYPPRDVAKQLLGPMPGSGEAQGFGAHELVCSIRGGEILRAQHPDYMVLPPNYYAQLAERSGKELVFFGQLGEDSYSASLRAAFPRARFVNSVSPAHDFEMLRRSRNIAISISTFSWLAAWLGTPEKVYVPVCGMLNPMQRPSQFFLPLDEAEYEYTLFPYTKSVNLFDEPVKFLYTQDLLARQARPVTVEELREIMRRVAGLQRRLPLVSGFDEAFYLSRYADVAEAVKRGFRSGLQHYYSSGFVEDREIMALDKGFYTAMYPDAAMAISEGHYASPLHHYQAVGRALGYLPTP
jgi:hypothetical protein